MDPPEGIFGSREVTDFLWGFGPGLSPAAPVQERLVRFPIADSRSQTIRVSVAAAAGIWIRETVSVKALFGAVNAATQITMQARILQSPRGCRFLAVQRSHERRKEAAGRRATSGIPFLQGGENVNKIFEKRRESAVAQKQGHCLTSELLPSVSAGGSKE